MAFSDHVKVLFGADTQGFQKALGTAEKKTKKFGDNFKKFFVGALGTTALVKTTQDVIQFGASIGDMSKRLGVSSQFLQGLQYGAEQSGVKAESASIAFQRFTRRTAEAGEKAGPLRDTLDKLGISLKDTNGVAKTSEELFREFGSKLTDIQNPAEKVRVAFQFLDTEGVALTQMFQQGGKSLDEFTQEAERLGLVMDQQTIDSLQNADSTLKQLGRQFKVFVANYLPDMIAKIKEFVPIVSQAFQAVKKWSGAIVGLVGAVASYKVSLAVMMGVAKVLPIFKGVTTATQALTVAVKGLNVATKLNPFGILIAGATALGIGIKLLIDKTNEYEKQLKQRVKDALTSAETKTKQYKQETLSLKTAIANVTQELRNFGKEADKKPQSLEEQITGYAKMRAELIMNAKQLELEERTSKNLIRIQKEIIDGYIEQGASAHIIAKEKAKLAGLETDHAKAQLAVVQNLKSQQDVSDNLIQKSKELADQEFARLNGLTGILTERQKEQVELERTLERIEAIKAGGEAELEVVKRKHALQDQIQALHKQGNMTLEEATNLATNLANATAQEKALHEQIKNVQQEKVNLKDQEADRQGILDALQQEANLQAQNKANAEAQIAILNQRAQGNNDIADAMQRQIDLGRQVDQIMLDQNLKGADAVNQLQRKLGLENKINFKKIEQKQNEIRKNAVEKQAQRDLKDAVDAKDRQRIRAARDVKRLEDRIADLQKQGGERAQNEIDRLNAVKERKLELALDDKTKDDLAQLEKKKVDIKDNHDAQMQALNEKLKAIQKAEADQALAQADAVKEANKEIAKEGEKQRGETQQVIDAGKEAIEDVGDAVKKLADRELDIKVDAPAVTVETDVEPLRTEFATLNSNIANLANQSKPIQAQPQVNVTVEAPEVPAVTNEITINLQSDLKQQTQDDILETLQGYFINQ